MKLRYPEDGYTRPAIIFFRAIGRLALRPRLSPPFRLLHHLPASSLFLFFHLSSVPLPSPKRKSMSMLCHFFHPLVPRSLSLSRARIVDISSSLFFPPPRPFARIMTESRRKMRRRESWREERVFPTGGAESLESRAHGCPRKSLFFASRRRETRARNT